MVRSLPTVDALMSLKMTVGITLLRFAARPAAPVGRPKRMGLQFTTRFGSKSKGAQESYVILIHSALLTKSLRRYMLLLDVVAFT
jgi:hypothetical protein